MTNELDDGDYVTDFTSAGPKNYGYKTKNGKVCYKVRGFTLNVRGQQQLNYIMRQNLLDELTDPLDERRNIDIVNPNFFTKHSTDLKQVTLWTFDRSPKTSTLSTLSVS